MDENYNTVVVPKEKPIFSPLQGSLMDHMSPVVAEGYTTNSLQCIVSGTKPVFQSFDLQPTLIQGSFGGNQPHTDTHSLDLMDNSISVTQIPKGKASRSRLSSKQTSFNKLPTQAKNIQNQKQKPIQPLRNSKKNLDLNSARNVPVP